METNTDEAVDKVPHPSDLALGLSNLSEGGGMGAIETNAEVERDARRQGWVPREQFNGDENDWIDAASFVQRGREINPILRANNERLKNQIDSLSNQNLVLVRELTDLKKGQATIQQRDYDTTLKMLKAARLEAMEGGDHEKFLALDEQIDQLRGQRDQLVPQIIDSPQQSSVPDPEFQAWHRENSWYGSDEWRTITINKVAEEIRNSYPQLVGRKFLDEVVLEAQSRYPKDFGSVERTRTSSAMIHSMVDGGASRRGVSYGNERKHTIAELPSDARAAMQKFVRDGLMTEKRYVELYFAGE